MKSIYENNLDFNGENILHQMTKNSCVEYRNSMYNLSKKLTTNINEREKIEIIGKAVEEKSLMFNFQVNNLFTLSEIKSGQLVLNPDSINFHKILDQVIENLNYLIESKKIRIDLKIFTRSNFKADKEKLKMILTNLVSNAIEFSSNHSIVQIIIFEGHKNFKVLVKDNGRGIKKSKQSKIFKEFYKSNKKTIRYQKNQGIGLNVVKGLVDFLEGKIEFHSVLEDFTLFEVTLPKL
eukprot:TRINITY_DN666124_c1_g1_i1.p1 TRINITY_DN666124_c1_g1~~TRINITY_DN666124_c1_g1_i1.p1  ORF type:complete len:259 (+),score=4.43 TRINITY_DN666124_c1_g1_i1:71-778(+)